MKSLIAYFSRAGENYVNGNIKNLKKGNNEILSEKLSKLLPDADVFKIEPKKQYSNDYYKCIDEAKKDLEKGVRPELNNKLDTIDGYDKIYLIYPIYWGTFPMGVFTFLESYDFSNKIIIPIATHEGSGFGASEVDLRRLLPNSDIKEGTAIFGSEVDTADPLLEELI